MRKITKAASAAVGAVSLLIFAFSAFLYGILPAQLYNVPSGGLSFNSSVSRFVTVEKSKTRLCRRRQTLSRANTARK